MALRRRPAYQQLLVLAALLFAAKYMPEQLSHDCQSLAKTRPDCWGCSVVGLLRDEDLNPLSRIGQG